MTQFAGLLRSPSNSDHRLLQSLGNLDNRVTQLTRIPIYHGFSNHMVTQITELLISQGYSDHRVTHITWLLEKQI